LRLAFAPHNLHKAAVSQPLSDPLAPAGALDALRVFSLSHRTCGLPALGGVVAHGDAGRLHASLTTAGIESIVLSTCNRFEVYWRTGGPDDDRTVRAMIEAALPPARDLLHGGSVQINGGTAAGHLFRVCSGLESMVLGEAEILGQVRAAMEQSPGAGTFLRGVFTAAIRTGRGARAATGIASGAMSVASAAVQQVETRLPLGASRVLIIGAGETAAKVARQLKAIGTGTLVIANRTLDKARTLAAAHGGIAAGLDAVAEEIAAADVVICATYSSSWMVTRAHVANRTVEKPVVLVDLSMPPAIEPFDADGVARIDLAAIERATAAHRQRREGEIPRVEAFIERELAWLRGWARQQLLRPFVSTLRQKADLIRREELERALDELKVDDPHAVMERFSRRMFDRLLKVPLDQLKSGDLPFDGQSADYLRRLFALDRMSELALDSSKREGES
jgi:glutamyl-tRNA reductase